MQENGSLDSALNQEYDFTIKEILSEAWELTNGAKLILNVSFILYILVAVVLSTLLSYIFDPKIYYDSHEFLKGFLSEQAQSLLSLPILMPIISGIVMMAIKRAAHKKIEVLSIFNYYVLVWPLVFASLFVNAVVIIGFLLLIIPGIYLSITFAFVIPLIIDKQLDILDAMKTSFKVVRKRWFKFFGVYLILIFLSILSLLTFGIGFIWVLPLSFMTNGVLYRRLFGYSNLENIEDESTE
ncbi:hypothetical protein [Sulfurimonas sp. HSL-1716]|uniref:hypothetical protein n=1 Tax=Hydrocurvibacter sulfurireducens TaxID=3131937 RepID=UPI0031F7B31F